MAQHSNIPFLKRDSSSSKKGDSQIDRQEPFRLDDIARHMLYNSDRAMGIFSQNETWLAVNAGLCRLLGAAEYKLIYNRLASFISEEEWQALANHLQELGHGNSDSLVAQLKIRQRQAKLKLSVIRGRNREVLYYLLEVLEIERGVDIALFPSRISETGSPRRQSFTHHENKARVINGRRKSPVSRNLRLYRGGRSVFKTNIPAEYMLVKKHAGECDETKPCVSWKLTGTRQAASSTRRSDTLSAVRQLAAGIAHEIRNPLTSVKGFVQLMRSRSLGNSAYLEVMDSELERIQRIINDFLIMANPAKSPYPYIDLEGLLGEIGSRMGQTGQRRLRICTETRQNPLILRGDYEQLMQAFTHIVQNSLDAIDQSGQLTIYAKRQAERVIIRFVDNGRGIPADRLEKLGEPYFVTNEKGSGFGLMTSFTIIEAHGGTIRINSVLGQGTIVEVSLPIEVS
ncbi:ATP-binding protein [Paenibacillus senegalensis]|uniref:ATP-binding protein n=1 Tax=Paenibacillus senegalensis TaxID=1465766 RepID=UPI00138B0223|nr:ATP-binding protein [Paenibacillus senegalensis]